MATTSNNSGYYAPLLRGAFMARSLAPCVVKTEAKSGSGALEIALPAEAAASTEAASLEKTAKVIHDAVSAAPNGVSSVTIRAGGSEFYYGISSAPCERRAETSPLRGKTALVTGGAQGFGEEIVRALVKDGTIVFIADMNLDGASRLAENLKSQCGASCAYPVAVNVSDEESVEKMFNAVVETVGGLDLCVSNAGVLRASPILEQDIKDFAFVTSVNYTAFAIITKHAARIMKAQSAGAGDAPLWSDIIQINSKSGLEGSNKNGAYAGSKFGGIGLVQSFALELVEHRIKVNAICPGNFFDGPLWSDSEKGLFVQYLKAGKVPGAKTVADVKAFYEAKVPMGRGCLGADVMKAIRYIVEQVYETGQAVPVTGGQVMMR